MNELLAGALSMAFAVAGLFFLRFWRKTRDRLFALFAVSFWLLAASRAALTLLRAEDESRTYLYVVRLAAFVLILIAIIDKNSPSKRSRDG